MTVNSGQIQDRVQNNAIADRKGARYILLSEIANKKVQTESGISIGRLKDLVFKDDPHYAEVTSLIVGRSMGRPPLNIPWNSVVNVGTERTVVQDPKDGQFLEVNEDEDQLLLWDRIIDKRILDTKGFAVEVVYDIQLLLVDNKLFIVGADVGRQALMRRLGLRRISKSLLEGGSKRIIPWRFVQPIGPDLTSTKGDVKLTIAEEGLRDIHPEDVADILEELSREERIHVFNALDTVSAANALEATEPRVQREILASTSSERVLEIFAHLTAVQIADIISILPRDNAETLLKMLKGDVASRIHQLLSQHDVPASILATRRFLAFPGDLTVADAFSKYREEARRIAVTMYIYIVDSEQHLRGVVDIMELLQADPKAKLEEIMTKNCVTVAPNTMRGEVEALFLRYHFRAIPAVDESRKIIGVVREKDVFLTDEQR
jgi:CBS domain-containing protein